MIKFFDPDPGWKKFGYGIRERKFGYGIRNTATNILCSTGKAEVPYLIHVFVPVFIMKCGGRDSRQLREKCRVRQVEPGK
jgi:hypothetical protein